MKANRMDNTVVLEDLPDIWQAVDCTVTFEGEGPLCQWPHLLPRMRGALGRVLGQSASHEALSGAPCPFDPPCAYDLFHNSQGTLESGLDIPKPYVLRADNIAGDLSVSLRLFGEACKWSGDFHTALIAAGRRGINTSKQTRKELSPKAAYRRDVSLSDLPQQMPQITLVTRTPIEQRKPQNPGPHGLNIASLLTNSANRLRGLARWHGTELVNDAASLKQRASTWSDTAQVQIANDTTPRQARGFSGTIVFPRPDPTLTLLLRLVETSHIAHGSTHGQGRFDLLP